MAAILDPHIAPPKADHRLLQSRPGDGLDEVFQPVIAGAYARGLADAFELLGQAAVFLGRSGQVLFVTAAARPILDPGVDIRAGHLLARDGSDNDVLAAFASAALGDVSVRPSVTLPRCGLTLQALPAGGPVAGSDQLLQAVILVGDPSGMGKNGVDATLTPR